MSIDTESRAWGHAVLIEQEAYRNRWLMVKQLLSELYPAERMEALDAIILKSKRVTKHQQAEILEIINNSSFITLDPQE